MKYLVKRGLEENRLKFVPDEGEIFYTVDEKRLYFGDGTTAGGIAFEFFRFLEWDLLSVAGQTEYIIPEGKEALPNINRGKFLVFYGGAKLSKGDYEINSDENKIILKFSPERDENEINIHYIGI